MIALKINNSYSSISGLSIEQFKTLREILSYKLPKAQSYFSRDPAQGKRYLLDKRGEFPTGLLYLVEIYLSLLSRPVSKLDHRKRPEAQPGRFEASMSLKPYPEQITAAKMLFRAHRGICSAVTGFGKSLIIALLVDLLQVRTLVVVPSLELKTQLRETLKKIFPKTQIGGLGLDIAVENIAALDPKKKLIGYDAVIIDEFHHSAAKTYRELNKKSWVDVYHRFGFTATCFRSISEEKLLLESMLSQVVYKIDHAEAVSKGYVLPLEAYYFELPKIEVKSADNWAAVYSELIVNRKDRNEKIVSLGNRLFVGCKSTLILVNQIDHGEILQQMFSDIGLEVPFANGEDSTSSEHIADFSCGKLKLLVASSVVGEGVDTRACEYIILAGGSGKSRVKLMQNAGRSFRKFVGKDSGKIITFKDYSHKWLIGHHAHFMKTMREEYGVKSIKLE